MSSRFKLLVAAGLFACSFAAGASAEEHVVKMLNANGKGKFMLFDPEVVHAKVGDTVKFVPTNKGHNAETIPELWPEGVEAFKRQATLVRRYGAAAVVMAFDEKGQADTYARKTEICERAYRILVDEVGFPPEDIIFDPNIFAIATGIEEHDNYAVDFIEATRWIKQNLPGAKVSGGVSNVSFSFRGNDPVREAIHTVFLYHAIRAGMDMGIVNAGMIGVYDELDPVLRERVEDVVLNRRRDAGERLVEIAERAKGAAKEGA